jgi:hypothetical protein
MGPSRARRHLGGGGKQVGSPQRAGPGGAPRYGDLGQLGSKASPPSSNEPLGSLAILETLKLIEPSRRLASASRGATSGTRLGSKSISARTTQRTLSRRFCRAFRPCVVTRCLCCSRPSAFFFFTWGNAFRHPAAQRELVCETQRLPPPWLLNKIF